MKIYTKRDVKQEVFPGMKVAVIGYGAQGRAQALNLRDSGVDVLVGLRPEGRSWSVALEDGMTVKLISEATEEADYIQILVPDEVHRRVFEEHVKESLRPGKLLGFAHGFSIRFGLVQPPEFVDVVMVAPKGPGKILRELYKQGSGIAAELAVHQDYTGRAREVALGYADAIGCTRIGVMETTFTEETETDLFSEQAVLCGGIPELIRAGFETLVKQGYQPEIAYYECLLEAKLVVDLIAEFGIAGMYERVSRTAAYGGLTRGRQIISGKVREAITEVLNKVKSGEFAREWLEENSTGCRTFQKTLEGVRNHEIEEVGDRVRELLSS